MTIHREGRLLLLVLTIIFVGLNVGLPYLAASSAVVNTVLISSIVIFLLILQFFRSPKIETKPDENLVYAPADGKVVVIEEVHEDEFIKDQRLQVSIFMSPINVHVNRMPVAGIVQFFKYHAGKYLVAWHPKSSTENERTTMVIRMKNGLDILVRQIAGALARRIKWYVKEGDELAQGKEFGFIKFGSRVDVFLPLDATVKVKIGDKTTAGKSVLAELP